MRPPKHRPRILVGLTGSTRHTVARLVVNLGIEVVVVSNGLLLLECLADPTRSPDIIIMNPTLPGCSGGYLLEHLEELGRDTPVVFIIGDQDHLGRRQAWSESVAGVFFEPLSEDQLSAFINLIIDPQIVRALRVARSAVRST